MFKDLHWNIQLGFIVYDNLDLFAVGMCDCLACDIQGSSLQCSASSHCILYSLVCNWNVWVTLWCWVIFLAMINYLSLYMIIQIYLQSISTADESHSVGRKLQLHPFLLWSVCSSDVYRHESGRCCSLPFFLIYFLSNINSKSSYRYCIQKYIIIAFLVKPPYWCASCKNILCVLYKWMKKLTSALETVATSDKSAIVMCSPAAQVWPSRHLLKNPNASSNLSCLAGSNWAPANTTGI